MRYVNQEYYPIVRQRLNINPININKNQYKEITIAYLGEYQDLFIE